VSQHVTQPRRLASGGRIDRSAPLRFTFDGAKYEGFHGDTLASALLANAVGVVGHGIESGRPRGILTAGVEEPNALVDIETTLGSATMVRATTIELVEGLRARPLRGRGELPGKDAAPHTRSDRRHVHCDVLVVGSGPAGLTAARAAGRSGARVVVVDEQVEPGGDLLSTSESTRIGGLPPGEWVTETVSELEALPEVTLLPRSTAATVGDHGFVVVVERRAGSWLGGCVWHVRAGQIVLASGAHELPVVFADNDRPGIMLAGAVRTYLHRFGVRPGTRAVVAANNDQALAVAGDLEEAGVEVARIVDLRTGVRIVGTTGVGAVEAALVAAPGMPVEAIACDLLAVSGGWNPAVQLLSQAGGTITFDERVQAFVPDVMPSNVWVVGAADGTFGLEGCLASGLEAGTAAARAAGFPTQGGVVVPSVASTAVGEVGGALAIPPLEASPSDAWLTHFVDFERDVTVADLRRAVDAGLESIEHIKRYTTLGTGTDQGKTSWTTASLIVADMLGRPPGALGMPRFRGPYAPVAFELLAGRERGELYDPVRVTPMHDWHARYDAVFENVGQWKRPLYYPRPGETMDQAVQRECQAARTGVAVVDVSTLGRIDIQGPDSGEFLNRIYTNVFDTLPIGACRYGVMCRLDGMVFDDGVTSRLASDRFHMTTTTGNAAAVLDHLEEWLQTEWPQLGVRCTSVTEQWAVAALVGPQSRDVLRRLAPALDVSAEGFPFMTWRDATVGDLPARVFRISFSGELAYEINVASWHGLSLWEAIMAAGADLGITPYGTQTLYVLRAEKGYPIIGQETDGTVTPQDLGLNWIVSKRKDFIGRRSHARSDTARPDRKQLVSLLPTNPEELLPEGAQLVDEPDHAIPIPMVGHVTSSYRSVALGRTFALALVRGGRDRLGQTIFAPLRDRTIPATIGPAVLYDPENHRRDG
jgi:sarcosine oxidase subunit alpha